MEKLKELVRNLVPFMQSLNKTKRGILLIIVLTLLRKLYRALQSGKKLQGETVLVTGAGSGIGRQLAFRFARLGAKVCVADINFKAAEQVASAIKIERRQAIAVHCDVTSPDSVREAMKQVRDELGVPTILVNNAGIVIGKSLMNTTLEEHELIFKVNALSHFTTIKELLPGMISLKKGHIVTIASAAGHMGVPGLVDYCATKHAAVGLDAALRNELKSEGHGFIKTTCVNPYFINTGMFGGISLYSRIFLPYLDEQWVANRIIRAIRMEEEEVFTPYLIKLGLYVRYLLPQSMADFIGDLFGYNKAMSTFKGHN